MEEADKILITQVKQLGVTVQSLGDFDSTQFITLIILCFERLTKLLVDKDNFIDMPFLKKQNLQVATHRYKVCQKFTEYLKTLGYSYDLSFNAFLYPNIKDTRRLLGYLFDIIFQQEADGQNQNQQKERPTNQYAELIRRRLIRWQKKPWIMPDFIASQRRNLLVSSEVVQCDKNIDFQRVANSKSKKIKTLYTVMQNQLSVTQTSENFAAGLSMVGLALSQASFTSGQQKLQNETKIDFFQDEDDGKNKTINTTSILQSFTAAVAQTVQPPGSTPQVDVSIPISAQVANTPHEKTLKEILEERESELKELEQLNTIQDTVYMEALADDIEEKPQEVKKTEQSRTQQKVTEQIDQPNKDQTRFQDQEQEQRVAGGQEESVAQKRNQKVKEIVEYDFDVQTAATDISMISNQSSVTAKSDPVIDLNKELAAKFNIDALREEKEAEISKYVAQLEVFKTEIEKSQSRAQTYTQSKSSLEEEKTEMASNLKTVQKQVKKKKEVLKEVEKLSGQDLRVLQQEVATINNELETLKEEWEEYKKPIKEEIFETKQQISDKRVEYSYKADKIKELKRELKQAVADIEHKKKVFIFMEQEWNAMPKDVNRNQYTKRITEIIGSLKIQNGEIKTILQDIEDIKKQTTDIMQQIKVIDSELEDIVFKDAQKDKVAKDIYKEIMSLKQDFAKLIQTVQDKNKMKTQMNDVQVKMEDFRIKYKNMSEINKLKAELQGVLNENAMLQQKK